MRQEFHGVDAAPGLVSIRRLQPVMRVSGPLWDADDESPCEETFEWTVGDAHTGAGYGVDFCCLEDIIGT